MNWLTAIVVYILVWFVTLFAVLVGYPTIPP
jgi:predicted secreted protein